MPVGAVARRLGYRSETAFGRAFRRHTGHTPTDWRRATRVPAEVSAPPG
ncbi:helix-turn-helix domain-containing protein [Nocardia salmonicida]